MAQATRSPLAQVVSRSVEVRMNDQMRFEPSNLQVRAGETVRFFVRNEGQLTHEMVIGTAEAIREHAAAMQKGAAHAHGSSAAAISVAPKKAGELVVTFKEPASLELACLEPGHFEAGMRGKLLVAQAESEPPAPVAAPRPKLSHDGQPHKH